MMSNETAIRQLERKLNNPDMYGSEEEFRADEKRLADLKAAPAPTPWVWTDVEPAELKIGDIVQDAYANPAVVIQFATPDHVHQMHVTIMQLVGSDRGRTGGMPLYIRRLDTPEVAEKIRERARQIWREKHAR